MIRRFLTTADATKPNPYYRRAAPQKLYLRARVIQAEAGPEFETAKNKARQRSLAASERCAIARDSLCSEALSRVRLHKISLDRLRQLALEHQRLRWMEQGECDNPALAPEHHIRRWMVNYARHHLSNYDDVRETYHGKIGVQDAAELVREAVLERIGERWPELRGACEQARR